MIFAAFVKFFVGVAHCFRLTATQHDLKPDRLEAGIIVTVNHTGRAGNAFPRAEPSGQAFTRLVLHKDVQKPFQDEKGFFDLMCVRRISLARLDIHDAERMRTRRDRIGIAVLAGSAGANEAVLGPFIPFYLGILERFPVGTRSRKRAT